MTYATIIVEDSQGRKPSPDALSDLNGSLQGLHIDSARPFCRSRSLLEIRFDADQVEEDLVKRTIAQYSAYFVVRPMSEDELQAEYIAYVGRCLLRLRDIWNGQRGESDDRPSDPDQAPETLREFQAAIYQALERLPAERRTAWLDSLAALCPQPARQ